MRDKPLTTGEVARHCHVTDRAVLKWITQGRLKAYRTPGNHCRIRQDDFLIFLKKYNMPLPDAGGGIMTKKRILIVDDDKNTVSSIRRVLRMKGAFEVDVAYDGFDAGRKLLEFRPDIVLLDIKMPNLDGYEVTRRIKQNPVTKDIKIIAISGFLQQEGTEKIASLGVEAYLAKPFSPQALKDQIDTLL